MRIERTIEPEAYLSYARRVEYTAAEWIIAAHHGDRIVMHAVGQQLGKQSQLGGEIVLNCAVIVQMVTAQVGEDRGAEIEPVRAALRQADIRYLGEGMHQPLAFHLRERR